jgi:hypothetical protein
MASCISSEGIVANVQDSFYIKPSNTSWEIEQANNKGTGHSVYDDIREKMREENAPKIVDAKQLNTCKIFFHGQLL